MGRPGRGLANPVRGHTRLACYLEVLAGFRPDPQLAVDLADIDEDPADADRHPTAPAGSLPTTWAQHTTHRHRHPHRPLRAPRGRTVAAHAPRQVPADGIRYGLPDLDAAAVRLAEPRVITQAIAAWIYQQSAPTGEPIAGVSFDSRHGDAQRLWAVFEREGDGETSHHLRDTSTHPVDIDDTELHQAMHIAPTALGQLTIHTPRSVRGNDNPASDARGTRFGDTARPWTAPRARGRTSAREPGECRPPAP